MQISWNVFSDLLSPSRTTTTIDFSNSRVLLHYEDLCQTICGQRRRVDWFPSMQVELVLGQIMPDHERMQCTCSQPTITVECVIWEGLPKKPKEWSFWNLHSLRFIDPVWFLVYLIHGNNWRPLYFWGCYWTAFVTKLWIPIRLCSERNQPYVNFHYYIRIVLVDLF